jgi:hypothetical protein
MSRGAIYRRALGGVILIGVAADQCVLILLGSVLSSQRSKVLESDDRWAVKSKK